MSRAESPTHIGLTDEEIALACASHSGEPAHVATAAAMLAKAGRTWPASNAAPTGRSGEAAQLGRLAASGAKPTALHNNCSGKHAGFVCLACGSGTDPAGYVKADHRVQQRGARGARGPDRRLPMTTSRSGIDGCSIPTYAIPLAGPRLRLRPFRYRRLASRPAPRRRRVPDPPGRGRSTRSWWRAPIVSTPSVMEILGERAFVKVGAEGVYCAALPELGYGIAVEGR